MQNFDFIWREDITNALMAAAQATEAALATNSQDDAYKTGYRHGYQAALVSLAIAFGILPGTIVSELEPGLQFVTAPPAKAEGF